MNSYVKKSIAIEKRTKLEDHLLYIGGSARKRKQIVFMEKKNREANYHGEKEKNLDPHLFSFKK